MCPRHQPVAELETGLTMQMIANDKRINHMDKREITNK